MLQGEIPVYCFKMLFMTNVHICFAQTLHCYESDCLLSKKYAHIIKGKLKKEKYDTIKLLKKEHDY